MTLAFTAPSAQEYRADSGVGIALGVLGAVAVFTCPRSRSGDLLGLAGVTWFAGNFAVAGAPWLADLGQHTVFLHRGVLVHAAATIPWGRAGRMTWSGLAACYLLALAVSVQRSHAGVLVWGALAICVAAIEVARRKAATTADRTLALAASGLFAGGIAVMLDIDAYRLLVVVTAALVTIGSVVAGRRRARISESIIELVHGRDAAVRSALVTALGDPQVEIAFADGESWTDELGRRVPAPVATPGRAVTLVEGDGHPIAAVCHAAEVASDPALTRSLAAATALAADHVRLRAAVRRATSEVVASRWRMAESATAARVEFAAVVRSGPDANLAAALDELATVGGSAPTAIAAITGLREELDALVAGLGPLSSSAGRLTPALHSLARRSPLDVTVQLDHGEEPVGSAAETLWFVAAEGLANIAKHTTCQRATINLVTGTDTASITISDDGPGGAGMHAGSGLQGLSDRVAAAGGTFRVESGEAGTHLEAIVPTGQIGSTG